MRLRLSPVSIQGWLLGGHGSQLCIEALDVPLTSIQRTQWDWDSKPPSCYSYKEWSSCALCDPACSFHWGGQSWGTGRESCVNKHPSCSPEMENSWAKRFYLQEHSMSQKKIQGNMNVLLSSTNRIPSLRELRKDALDELWIEKIICEAGIVLVLPQKDCM